jgi:hypothetical protein
VMSATTLSGPWTPVVGQGAIAGTGAAVNETEPLTGAQSYYTVKVQ